MDMWTVERGGTVYGPVSWEQMAEWARQGLISPTDMLRRPGTSAYYRASQVPGLLPANLSAISAGAGVAAASAATQVPWIAIAVVVSIVTIGSVLGVRAIGGHSEFSSVTTPAQPTTEAVSEYPGSNTLENDTTIPENDTTMPASPTTEGVSGDPGTSTSTSGTSLIYGDPSPFIGKWEGIWKATPPTEGSIDSSWWLFFMNRRVFFEVALVEGSDGPELRVWGCSELPPGLRRVRFDAVSAMATSDGSFSFTIVYPPSPENTSSGDILSPQVFNFYGRRTGEQIKGTFAGENFDRESTAEGTFLVNPCDYTVEDFF